MVNIEKPSEQPKIEPKKISKEQAEQWKKEEGITPEFQKAINKGIIPDFEKSLDEVVEIAGEVLPEKTKPWAKDWPRTLKEKIVGKDKILKELDEAEDQLQQTLKEVFDQYYELIKDNLELDDDKFKRDLNELEDRRIALVQYKDKIQFSVEEEAEIQEEMNNILKRRIDLYHEEIDRIKRQLEIKEEKTPEESAIIQKLRNKKDGLEKILDKTSRQYNALVKKPPAEFYDSIKELDDERHELEKECNDAKARFNEEKEAKILEEINGILKNQFIRYEREIDRIKEQLKKEK